MSFYALNYAQTYQIGNQAGTAIAHQRQGNPNYW